MTITLSTDTLNDIQADLDFLYIFAVEESEPAIEAILAMNTPYQSTTTNEEN